MKFVKESLTDVLVPKSQDEIDQALDKWSLEEKIDMVENNIDADLLFTYMIKGGAKRNDVIEPFLDIATEKELKEIILEMVDSDEDIETIFYFTTGGGGRIEEEKIKRAYKQFVESTSSAELHELINNMIMQHPELISKARNNDWYGF